jgi:hypothetical protein
VTVAELELEGPGVGAPGSRAVDEVWAVAVVGVNEVGVRVEVRVEGPGAWPVLRDGLGTWTPTTERALAATSCAGAGRTSAAARLPVSVSVTTAAAATALRRERGLVPRRGDDAGPGALEGPERIASTIAGTAATSRSSAPEVGPAAIRRREATSP